MTKKNQRRQVTKEIRRATGINLVEAAKVARRIVSQNGENMWEVPSWVSTQEDVTRSEYGDMWFPSATPNGIIVGPRGEWVVPFEK